MKNMSLIFLAALALLLTPFLAQGSEIDPGALSEITEVAESAELTEITETTKTTESTETTSDSAIDIDEDGTGDIPIIAVIDPPAPPGPGPDPRPDPPIDDPPAPPPQPPAVPLPSTIILVGSGLLGLGLLNRRRKRG